MEEVYRILATTLGSPPKPDESVSNLEIPMLNQSINDLPVLSTVHLRIYNLGRKEIQIRYSYAFIVLPLFLSRRCFWIYLSHQRSSKSYGHTLHRSTTR